MCTQVTLKPFSPPAPAASPEGGAQVEPQATEVLGEAVPAAHAALPAVMEARIIAGIKWECTPRYSPCCPDPANYTYAEGPEGSGRGVPPCVQSPRGFQADMFLYVEAYRQCVCASHSPPSFFQTRSLERKLTQFLLSLPM